MFVDDRFDEDKQVAIDLYLSGGRADIRSLRERPQRGWTAIRQREQNKEQTALQENRPFNRDNLNKATAALEATEGFLSPDVRIPQPVSSERTWLHHLPDGVKAVFTLASASRLIVGMANGVLENAGCMLHHRYGFPIIPGSALKGIARDAAAILGISSEQIRRIFGNDVGDSAECQGIVAFLDAWASPKPGQFDLELEVLTPHYQNYYNVAGNREAYDTEPPIPSVFPAVSSGISFEFAMILRKSTRGEILGDEVLGIATVCLKHALLHLGVGAKTAVGYGRFEVEADERPHIHVSEDLFPKPIISLSDQLRADWKGKSENTFHLKRLIRALAEIEDDAELAMLFDELMPANHLANFYSVTRYWAAFLREGGKSLLERMHRTLPRQ